jgi:hypothetical protein
MGTRAHFLSENAGLGRIQTAIVGVRSVASAGTQDS